MRVPSGRVFIYRSSAVNRRMDRRSAHRVKRTYSIAPAASTVSLAPMCAGSGVSSTFRKKGTAKAADSASST